MSGVPQLDSATVGAFVAKAHRDSGGEEALAVLEFLESVEVAG